MADSPFRDEPDQTDTNPQLGERTDDIDMKELFNEKTPIKSAYSYEFNERMPIEYYRCLQSLPKRYILAIMVFLGFCNIYALRSNLSVAIVEMVSNKSVTTTNNGTLQYFQEFNWSPRLQGVILSSFFYGYIVTQLPGGWLATKFGGKVLFGCSVCSTALFTILTPLVVVSGPSLLITLRIIEGFCEGVSYPAAHVLWSKWAPPLERTRLTSCGYAGSYIGTVISMPVSGLLARHLGWPSIFYVFGTFGVLWFIFWWLLISDTPIKHPSITQEEQDYIQTSIGVGDIIDVSKGIPWKNILTSGPVYAIIVAHFCENWGFYTLLTQLPTFLNQVYHFDIDKAGLLSGLPYLVMAIVLIISGQLADYIRAQGRLSTTAVRKLFCTSAFIVTTIFLIATGYAQHWYMAVGFLCVAVGFCGLAWNGFGVNHLDIAPQYAGLLMGLSNTFATIPGIIAPSIAGIIVQNENVFDWRLCYTLSAAFTLVAAVFYYNFASGVEQSWSLRANRYEACRMDEKTFAEDEGDKYQPSQPLLENGGESGYQYTDVQQYHDEN